jgi:hypothetical protein
MEYFILGDENEGYNGYFECLFREDDKEYALEFNLDNWKSNLSNGRYGGSFVEFYEPRNKKIKFNRSYETTKEECREMYEQLCLNGWTVKKE